MTADPIPDTRGHVPWRNQLPGPWDEEAIAELTPLQQAELEEDEWRRETTHIGTPYYAEPEINWTWELPERAGLYYLRYPPSDELPDPPLRVVDVFFLVGGDLWAEWSDIPAFKIEPDKHQWSNTPLATPRGVIPRLPRRSRLATVTSPTATATRRVSA